MKSTPGSHGTDREAVVIPALRKAAILVSSLDHPLAEALLARLSPAEAAAVRQAAAQLQHVAPAEAESLALEFRQVRPSGADGAPRGGTVADDVSFEPSWSSAEDAAAPEFAPAADEPSPTDARPFRFLSEADSRSLIPFLGKEHPQTIAVVLSYLPAERAAEVLVALPTPLQTDVMSRLADLDTTDDESLRVVEHEVRQWMEAQRERQHQRAKGLGAISSILAAAPSPERRRLLRNLYSANHPLAQRIAMDTADDRRGVETTAPARVAQPAGPMMATPFAFDDLLHLDAPQLATIVADTEPELVILALAGASEPLVRHVLQGIPAQTAARLKEGLQHIGPIRISDVEAAQRALAELAGNLYQNASGPPAPRLRVAA